MPSTDYYLLRMTAEQRDWLLAKLHGAPDDTGTAIVLYSRLLDAELHDGRLQLPAAPAPNPNEAPARIAALLREGYGPVGNAPADPPGKHPHLASREQILERAEQLISHDRAQTYGDARESFRRIGLLWSDIIGTPITATDVARMMIAMKLSRLTRDPAHADSWVDICGYAALGAEIAEVEL